jgi:hypothetical protein
VARNTDKNSTMKSAIWVSKIEEACTRAFSNKQNSDDQQMTSSWNTLNSFIYIHLQGTVTIKHTNSWCFSPFPQCYQKGSTKADTFSSKQLVDRTTRSRKRISHQKQKQPKTKRNLVNGLLYWILKSLI